MPAATAAYRLFLLFLRVVNVVAGGVNLANQACIESAGRARLLPFSSESVMGSLVAVVGAGLYAGPAAGNGRKVRASQGRMPVNGRSR